MTMTSKERMLCALDRGKPDRLPFSVHQWQGYHLDKYLGGIDQFNTVTEGTPDYIREKVLEVFETIGSGGGYICALSDHFFETPPEKIQAFANAARECVY